MHVDQEGKTRGGTGTGGMADGEASARAQDETSSFPSNSPFYTKMRLNKGTMINQEICLRTEILHSCKELYPVPQIYFDVFF